MFYKIIILTFLISINSIASSEIARFFLSPEAVVSVTRGSLNRVYSHQNKGDWFRSIPANPEVKTVLPYLLLISTHPLRGKNTALTRIVFRNLKVKEFTPGEIRTHCEERSCSGDLKWDRIYVQTDILVYLDDPQANRIYQEAEDWIGPAQPLLQINNINLELKAPARSTFELSFKDYIAQIVPESFKAEFTPGSLQLSFGSSSFDEELIENLHQEHSERIEKGISYEESAKVLKHSLTSYLTDKNFPARNDSLLLFELLRASKINVKDTTIFEILAYSLFNEVLGKVVAKKLNELIYRVPILNKGLEVLLPTPSLTELQDRRGFTKSNHPYLLKLSQSKINNTEKPYLLNVHDLEEELLTCSKYLPNEAPKNTSSSVGYLCLESVNHYLKYLFKKADSGLFELKNDGLKKSGKVVLFESAPQVYYQGNGKLRIETTILSYPKNWKWIPFTKTRFKLKGVLEPVIENGKLKIIGNDWQATTQFNDNSLLDIGASLIETFTLVAFTKMAIINDVILPRLSSSIEAGGGVALPDIFGLRYSLVQFEEGRIRVEADPGINDLE